MEKMCTVQMVEENGYKPDSDFDNQKCLTKEEFLGHFSKDNYEFSISDDRGTKQLFPYSAVSESYNVKEPSIIFDIIEFKEVDSNVTNVTNNFTYSNLENLVASIINDTSSEEANAGSVDVSGTTINVTLSENNSSDDYHYTVTLKGNRVDRVGEYSKSFTIIQKYFAIDIKFEFNTDLGRSLKTNFIPQSGETITMDIPDSYEVYLASGVNKNGDPVLYKNDKYSSGKWTFYMGDDKYPFAYSMTKKPKVDGGKDFIVDQVENYKELVFDYGTNKAYKEIAVKVKDFYRMPITVTLTIDNSIWNSTWQYALSDSTTNIPSKWTTIAKQSGTEITVQGKTYLWIWNTSIKDYNIFYGDTGLTDPVGIALDGYVYIGYDDINGSGIKTLILK